MTRRFAYTVTVTLPDQHTADTFIQWLLGGHIQAVLAAGADTADVAQLDSEPTPTSTNTPVRVQTNYTFPSRAHYDRYVETAAPALRADGIQRFGEIAQFERTLGEILSEPPPARHDDGTTQPPTIVS